MFILIGALRTANHQQARCYYDYTYHKLFTTFFAHNFDTFYSTKVLLFAHIRKLCTYAIVFSPVTADIDYQLNSTVTKTNTYAICLADLQDTQKSSTFTSSFTDMGKKQYIAFLFFIAVALLGCTPRNTISDPALQQASDLLWSHTDSAMSLLSVVSADALNDYDAHRCELLRAHLQLKQTQQLPPDANLIELSDYFDHRHDEPSAGEALYIQGAYENRIGDDVHAMEHLKQAEQYTTTDIIRGMTYYKMGRISETEQLYDVASHYYEQALPHLVAAGYPLYIASAYRDLARTVQDSTDLRQDSLRRCYFDSALHYAQAVGDTLLYLDVLYSRTAMLSPQSPDIERISRYLCDTVGLKRYAYDLVKYYIRHGDAEMGRTYLDVLAQDTAQLRWSKYQYMLWRSRYLHLLRDDRAAYDQLLSLYTQRSADTDAAGESRTYVIAQRYDNEVERAKNLQLQLEKQQLYITITAIVIVVLVLAILVIVYTLRRRTQVLVERERTAKQIENLSHELQLRRDALKRVLEQRISLSKSLQEAILHKRDDEAVPQWAKDFIDTNIFTSTEQWQDFLAEFNGCYGNLLTRLKQDYPALTNADLQVIALIVSGLDISDICLLLGLTQHTIWSRRLRIKSHAGLERGTTIEAWIREEMLKHDIRDNA